MTQKRAADSEESRGIEILVGGAILFTVAAVVVGFLMGWRFVPGWVGESLGTVAGILSTPFFMEASFAIIGIFIVIGLNAWRRHKAGDEFVTIEVSEPANRSEAVDDGQ